MSDSLGLIVREKIRFAAIAIPLLGAIGGLMRTMGWSEKATLVAILPPFLIAFLGWHLTLAYLESRSDARLLEQKLWAEREARLQQQMREAVAEQQEELRQLRRRQQEEQERLLNKRATREQLKQMMERHRE